MKNQVLSIEQMKHLKELGVDTSKASMFYVPKLEPKGAYCLLNVKPTPIIPFVPAFTFHDIIDLLPKEIKTSTDTYWLTISIYDCKEWLYAIQCQMNLIIIKSLSQSHCLMQPTE